MGNPYVTDAGTYLLSVVFGLYILAVMLRFLFQLVRADFYNPVSQAVVRITNPPLRHLRRWIPGWRGIDLPSVVLMLALKALELWLTLLLRGFSPAPAGLLVLAVAEIASLAVYVLVVAVIIEVILSWVAPGASNPLVQLVYSLTRPVLRPARSLVPPIAGLDLSPLVAIVALQLGVMLVIAPLKDLGQSLL